MCAGAAPRRASCPRELIKAVSGRGWRLARGPLGIILDSPRLADPTAMATATATPGAGTYSTSTRRVGVAHSLLGVLLLHLVLGLVCAAPHHSTGHKGRVGLGRERRRCRYASQAERGRPKGVQVTGHCESF